MEVILREDIEKVGVRGQVVKVAAGYARVALLLAGFWVGAGRAAGRKEQTTIATNTPRLIDEPLDRRWLERSRRSPSADPLGEPVYRQAPLTPATWERLQRHPQFG